MTMRAFELFRFIHPDGSAKEWAYAETGGGHCEVRWGRAGHLSNAQRDVAWMVVRKREQEKLGKGYRHVGQVLIDDDGIRRPKAQDQAQVAQAPAADTATQPRTRPDITALLGDDDAGFYF